MNTTQAHDAERFYQLLTQHHPKLWYAHAESLWHAKIESDEGLAVYGQGLSPVAAMEAALSAPTVEAERGRAASRSEWDSAHGYVATTDFREFQPEPAVAATTQTSALFTTEVVAELWSSVPSQVLYLDELKLFANAVLARAFERAPVLGLMWYEPYSGKARFAGMADTVEVNTARTATLLYAWPTEQGLSDEQQALMHMLAQHNVVPPNDYWGLLSMHVLAVMERAASEKTVVRLRKELSARGAQIDTESLAFFEDSVPFAEYLAEQLKDPDVRARYLAARERLNEVLAAKPNAVAANSSEVGITCLEKMRVTMVRLGVYRGGGLEWFGTNLESNIFELCAGVLTMLKSISQQPPVVGRLADVLAYGWQCVPSDPNTQMILAGLHHENMGDMEGRYKAMLAAAPSSGYVVKEADIVEKIAQMLERDSEQALELGYERFGRYSQECAEKVRATLVLKGADE